MEEKAKEGFVVRAQAMVEITIHVKPGTVANEDAALQAAIRGTNVENYGLFGRGSSVGVEIEDEDLVSGVGIELVTASNIEWDEAEVEVNDESL